MSRPFSRIKLGYYPLPLEEAQNIKTWAIQNHVLLRKPPGQQSSILL